MKRKNISTWHCLPVQPTFIIGTFNEDGTPDFAPITWVSKTCEHDDEYLIVISMYGDKQTKRNTMRSGQFTMNLVTTGLLPLTDYFGLTSGKGGVKDAREYTWGKAEMVNAPALDMSPFVCECEVKHVFQTDMSHTFFCRVLNVQADAEMEVNENGLDLAGMDAVVYSGRYHSVEKCLGNIGDFLNK